MTIQEPRCHSRYRSHSIVHFTGRAFSFRSDKMMSTTQDAFPRGGGTSGLSSVWKEAFFWIPITHMASTAAAGVTAYSLSSHLTGAIFLTLALAVPVPMVIYYAFKTYHSKIEDERRHAEQ